MINKQINKLPEKENKKKKHFSYSLAVFAFYTNQKKFMAVITSQTNHKCLLWKPDQKGRKYAIICHTENIGENTSISCITPWYQYAYSPYCSIYIYKGADKENLFNNPELPYLAIINFILLTLMRDSGLIL